MEMDCDARGTMDVGEEVLEHEEKEQEEEEKESNATKKKDSTGDSQKTISTL